MSHSDFPYNPWPKNKLLKALGFWWSLPYGIGGFLFILYLLLTGNRLGINKYEGGVDIIVEGPFAERMKAKGWAALTQGWCMYYWGEANYTVEIACHERMHVNQALKWGWTFPFVYLAYYIARVPYRENPFEKDAYNRTAKLMATLSAPESAA
jgi:hypothetical protein